jgi:glycosyltransferase involved in cell wall biosynthesis
MKICIFTENHLKGGVDTFLINLVNAWPESSDRLILMCNSSHPGLETISKKVRRSFTIKKYNRLYASKLAAGQDNYGLGKLFVVRALFVLSYRFFQYPVLFPWYVFSLSLKFRRSNFDRLLVVNGGYPASLLCRAAIVGWRLSGKTTLGVMNFHNSAPVARRRYRYFEDFIDRLVVESSAYIVTVSRNCLESLNNRPAFRGFAHSMVIHNGLEDPLIQNEPREINSIDLDGNIPYLLMLATYEPRKGHQFLLKAFRLIHQAHPELQLQIYGYNVGNQKERVALEVERLGLEATVKLNDFTSAIFDLLKNAMVLVVPSQEYESFNLTIIEAMAFSVPIVTTDVGGMPEVLGNSGAGFSCAKDDHIEFAGAVNKILGDAALESRMRINGRQTFEDKFMANSMATKYRSLLV